MSEHASGLPDDGLRVGFSECRIRSCLRRDDHRSERKRVAAQFRSEGEGRSAESLGTMENGDRPVGLDECGMRRSQAPIYTVRMRAIKEL